MSGYTRQASFPSGLNSPCMSEMIFLTSFPVVLSHDHRKTIEKLYLSGQHLGPRELRPEPVDGKAFPKSTARNGSISIFAGPLAAVHVSADRGDRRDPAKRIDDLRAPDVAGMDDVIEKT